MEEARRKAEQEAAAKAKAADDARAQAQKTAERRRLAALKTEADRQRSVEDARKGPQPGQIVRDCTDGCPEMVIVPAGEFTMGSPAAESGRSLDEGPQRRVSIRQPFAVGKFEVTFAEWEACVAGGGCTSNKTPGDEGWGRGRLPVINISWFEAKAYCSWLNRRLGLPEGTYRLPSEAEWEYACRAGTESAFSFGTTISMAQVNHDGRNFGLGTVGKWRKRTVPVGTMPPNAWGLQEMHGNVWEWVEDPFGPYPDRPTDARPLGQPDMTRRVLRGGAWNYNAWSCRSASRLSGPPNSRYGNVGFRFARTLP